MFSLFKFFIESFLVQLHLFSDKLFQIFLSFAQTFISIIIAFFHTIIRQNLSLLKPLVTRPS